MLFILLLSSPLLAKEIFIRTGTSSVGGGFYQIGNTITQLGNRVLKDYNFTAVTGGSVKNCYNLDKKKLNLELCNQLHFKMLGLEKEVLMENLLNLFVG